MNYFGHAAIALFRDECPPFVLGAMVPDLCAMARIKPNEALDLELARGIEFHIQTDALFHQTETFINLNHRALRALRERKVRRGPARAAAHIGVEMLLDAELTGEAHLVDGYLSALRLGATEPRLFRGLLPAHADALRRLSAHLVERGKAAHEPSHARFVTRLGHTLEGRARLEPTRAELEQIADYLSTDRYVARQLPLLLEELEPLWEKPKKNE